MTEKYEKQLYLRYGKVYWENMKRNYLRENIRQDIENYRNLISEERELCRELKIARERHEDEESIVFTEELIVNRGYSERYN